MFFVSSQQFNNVNPVRHFFIMLHVFSDIREWQWVPTPPVGGYWGQAGHTPIRGVCTATLVVRLRTCLDQLLPSRVNGWVSRQRNSLPKPKPCDVTA